MSPWPRSFCVIISCRNFPQNDEWIHQYWDPTTHSEILNICGGAVLSNCVILIKSHYCFICKSLIRGNVDHVLPYEISMADVHTTSPGPHNTFLLSRAGCWCWCQWLEECVWVMPPAPPVFCSPAAALHPPYLLHPALCKWVTWAQTRSGPGNTWEIKQH